jgi:hypothetical protein
MPLEKPVSLVLAFPPICTPECPPYQSLFHTWTVILFPRRLQPLAAWKTLYLRLDARLRAGVVLVVRVRGGRHARGEAGLQRGADCS